MGKFRETLTKHLIELVDLHPEDMGEALSTIWLEYKLHTEPLLFEIEDGEAQLWAISMTTAQAHIYASALLDTLGKRVLGCHARIDLAASLMSGLSEAERRTALERARQKSLAA